MITAPFNFVPLSEKVFFPDWAEDVSHDIPFEDAQSGVIDITLTAKSPIFIRNQSNDRENASTEFCNYNGEYYIPSTSVKGMVRNVLEIMSFGKIPTDSKKHEAVTSVRDMSDSKKLVGVANGCGFLKQDENNDWIIIDYGKPRTIQYTNISSKIITINDEESINCDYESASEKYSNNELYKVINVNLSLKDLTNRDGKVIGKKPVAKISPNGEEAYLVLTGGIDNKKNEFVFTTSDEKSHMHKNLEYVVNKFKKVYFESNSVDGNFWKYNMNPNIGIPIFYKTKNNKITDIGLSQLFKLAYPYTINDAIKQEIEEVTVKIDNEYITDKALDLAESIFGSTRETFTSLKGRVSFSHFKVDKNPPIFGEKTVVLGSPNSSYYPEYINQNCKDTGVIQDEYSTLMNSSARISGWKRYPLHFNKITINSTEKSESSTTFTPLGNYSNDTFNEFIFKGKLRFHNLKKVELGALISALTFHGNNDTFFHNIGMAKSLGLGKIKINLDTTPYLEYLQEFEYQMTRWTEKELEILWIESPQIQELFTMAYKNLNIDNKLKYLKLDPERRINEFVDKKNEKLNREYKGRECLPKVSKMFDMSGKFPTTLLDESIIETMIEEYNKKEEASIIAKEEAERKKLFEIKLEEVNQSDNPQILQNFIEKYPEYEELDIIQTKLSELIANQQADRHQEVNGKVKNAYDAVSKKRGTKSYQKELEKFVKKWSAGKNNKGSKLVLEYVEKAKKEIK